MHIFYVPDISGDYCVLDEEESRHCQKVLRLKKGELIFLTDGKGNLYEAMIKSSEKKYTCVDIIKLYQQYQKRSFHLHIAIAPTKNIDRFEWFLEKSTEIGIDEITPLITTHSERNTVSIERLDRIIIAAMKQSLKAYKPKLNSIRSLGSFLGIEKSGMRNFIAHYSESGLPMLKDLYLPGSDSVVLIGPEGDFTSSEIENAEKLGYNPVSLGKSRLRTETAGLVACHTINLLNSI